MSDGGMMVSIGDTTYTSFLKDEVGGYRVIINGKTCVFQKENDPTILRYRYLSNQTVSLQVNCWLTTSYYEVFCNKYQFYCNRTSQMAFFS